jgi:dCTP deaminase
MSQLDTKALHRALDSNDWSTKLVVTPLLENSQVGEASIDLRLGNEFLLLRRSERAGLELEPGDPALSQERQASVVQAAVSTLYDAVTVPFGEGLWLHPQQFALGATFEFLRLPPSLSAQVLSRSTWGRLGLLVATAVTVQPGFAGCLTLELVNESDSPIKLYPGLKIAQLVLFALPSADAFWTTEDDARHAERYGDDTPKAPTYRWPTGPQAAQVQREFEELAKIRAVGAALSAI